MNAAVLIWGLVGISLGVLHALSLWRSTNQGSRVVTTFLRMALVTALFVGAALLGRILPLAIGWIIGFPVTAAALYLRRQT
jgi:hypothetical protein